MLSWANPIIPHELNTETETDLILNLNQLLQAYGKSATQYTDPAERSEYVKSMLEEIIAVCDQYISSISLDERAKKEQSLEEWHKRLCLQHPNLLTILEIQKKAVSLVYLPEAETEAKARWLLLKNLFGLGSGLSKPLEEEYWGEFKFMGEIAIARWLMESNYESKNEKLSVFEVLKREQLRTGIDKQAIHYFENAKNYEVSFDNEGKIYFQGRVLDTSRGSGTNIQDGECLFVAGVDGKVYTNNPKSPLLGDTHHSSFLQGRAVMCAGTLRVSNGQITQITVLSGHYKPRKQELLNFLTYLSTHCHVDLSKIEVIDKPGGVPKNALKYLKSKGNCLPDDVSHMFYDLAVGAFRTQDWDGCEKYLDQSCTLGNKLALCEKASLLLSVKQAYSTIPEKERKDMAQHMLEDLALTAPRNIALQARQLLFQHFKLNFFSKPLSPEPPKLTILEKLASLLDFLKQPEVKEAEYAPQKVVDEIYHLILTQNRIEDLYSLFTLVKNHNGGFKNFAKQDHILLLLQERAFELAKKDKIGITPREERELREIWREPISDKKQALGLFKIQSFEAQFDDLAANAQIKLLSLKKPPAKKY